MTQTPRRKPGPKPKYPRHILCQFSAQSIEQLDLLAHYRQVSRAELIRRAVSEMIKEYDHTPVKVYEESEVEEVGVGEYRIKDILPIDNKIIS